VRRSTAQTFSPHVLPAAETAPPDRTWTGGFTLRDTDGTFEVVSDNGFEGTLSAEAFGVTACLYAYSHLSFGNDEFARKCASQFHFLREYALEHAEVAAILAATD
jgi:hypothetical protein